MTPLFGWLPKNAEARVASTRIRCLNNLRQLRAEQFPIELYRPGHASRYRAVIFSKANKSKHVQLARKLKAQGTKIVFDLCDNHFLLKEGTDDLRQLFELADHWVASSQNLAETVRSHMGTDKPLTVIEDAVEQTLHGSWYDLSGRLQAESALRNLRRHLADASRKHGARHLVWFGNHKSSHGEAGLSHLATIRELLEDVNHSHPITLTVISNSRKRFDEQFADWQLPVHYLDWSAHTFLRALQMHQIAVIPIVINAFTAAKTNNRIALSLSQGLGVIADRIGSYEIFEHAAFLNQWREGLLTYLEQPETLKQHVATGQEIIQREFSSPVIASQWRTVLNSL